MQASRWDEEVSELDTETRDESREYPSRLFFMDLLLKEVQKSAASSKTLPELLDQLRVIWTVPNRDAVLTQLETHANRYTGYTFPEEMQGPIAEALSDLLHIADELLPGDRQKADFSISRIVQYLDKPHQMYVLAPWLRSKRRYRENTVMRTLMDVRELDPYAEYVVRYFRNYQEIKTLRLISTSRAASALIEPADLQNYFTYYLRDFREQDEDRDKGAKYRAMIAAKVLIVGERTIPPLWLEEFPEIFSWAIEHIGDLAYEPMLIWLIGEHPDNPEVLWSAVRTARQHFMNRALEKALENAQQLLLKEEGVMILRLDLKKSLN